jgi:hypothetical protein
MPLLQPTACNFTSVALTQPLLLRVRWVVCCCGRWGWPQAWFIIAEQLLLYTLAGGKPMHFKIRPHYEPHCCNTRLYPQAMCHMHAQEVDRSKPLQCIQHCFQLWYAVWLSSLHMLTWCDADVTPGTVVLLLLYRSFACWQAQPHAAA